jgi:hypothetical protein
MKEGINMGEIFVHVNVSLDGYIERANHEIEWQFVDDEFEESPRHICRSRAPAFCIGIGRAAAARSGQSVRVARVARRRGGTRGVASAEVTEPRFGMPRRASEARPPRAISAGGAPDRG